METSYDTLFELLSQKKSEQPDEFSEVISYISDEQLDASICELVAQLSQKEIQYTTFSHS
jgi:hypothetical protein